MLIQTGLEYLYKTLYMYQNTEIINNGIKKSTGAKFMLKFLMTEQL